MNRKNMVQRIKKIVQHIVYMFHLKNILAIDFKTAVLNFDTITLTVFSKQMTLRKIIFDNSVKYIPSTNNPPSETSHDHKLKTVSNPRKQNKKLSQNNEKLIKVIITCEGFRIL